MTGTATASSGESVRRFCADIGQDRLLVQGAGGNVSWKDKGQMWIKASGTWLADALKREIFVPLDLDPLRRAIDKGDFSAVPTVGNNQSLRPSIETWLHALMPHPIVVHLHAIEILAHLVKNNAYETIKSMVGNNISWAWVDYVKPGAALAQAVHDVLNQRGASDVIFLKNHGVIIGGADIDLVAKTLTALCKQCRTAPLFDLPTVAPAMPAASGGYMPVDDAALHLLARDPGLFNRVRSDWALFPDHVVFLGADARIFASWKELENLPLPENETPMLIFIRDHGVYVRPDFGAAHLTQLWAYLDVIVRQPPEQKLDVLSRQDITELLGWDSEKYRLGLTR